MNHWPSGSAYRYPLMLLNIVLFNRFGCEMRVGDG
jgi:hypothetical protein